MNRPFFGLDPGSLGVLESQTSKALCHVLNLNCSALCSLRLLTCLRASQSSEHLGVSSPLPKASPPQLAECDSWPCRGSGKRAILLAGQLAKLLSFPGTDVSGEKEC